MKTDLLKVNPVKINTPRDTQPRQVKILPDWMGKDLIRSCVRILFLISFLVLMFLAGKWIFKTFLERSTYIFSSSLPLNISQSNCKFYLHHDSKIPFGQLQLKIELPSKIFPQFHSLLPKYPN